MPPPADYAHGCAPAAASSALLAAQSGRVGGGHYAREFADAGCATIYRVHKLCAADEFGTISDEDPRQSRVEDEGRLAESIASMAKALKQA